MTFLEVMGAIFSLILGGTFLRFGIDYRYEILCFLRIIELDMNESSVLFRWRFRWSKKWHGRLK